MGQPKVTTPSRKGKHLTWDERLQIEVLLKKDHPIKEIAHFLERHPRTIEREVQKGEVNHLQSDLSVSKVYSSERGQAAHDLSATAKGPQLNWALTVRPLRISETRLWRRKSLQKSWLMR